MHRSMVEAFVGVSPSSQCGPLIICEVLSIGTKNPLLCSRQVPRNQSALPGRSLIEDSKGKGWLKIPQNVLHPPRPEHKVLTR